VQTPNKKASKSAKAHSGAGIAPKLSPREAVAAAQRVVVKVGTNVLMRDDGSASIGVLYGIAESLANLRGAGRQVLLVTSGAVGLGVQRLELASRPSQLPLVQACAAVGQSRLMSMYDDAFDKLGFRVAQVLLTEEDFRDAQRHENLRHTLETLLKLGVIPIINENDTVSTAELSRPDSSSAAGTHSAEARVFGDNDKLSALVLRHTGANLLVLLSDVDGLYTTDPRSHGAALVPELDGVTDAIRAFAKGGNVRGRGGMETKLEAARIANEAHAPAVIANGRTPGIIDLVCAGKPVGTVIFSAKYPSAHTRAGGHTAVAATLPTGKRP
jgi:glutamate 5-kinase